MAKPKRSYCHCVASSTDSGSPAAALLLALPVTLATPGAIPVLAAPVQPSGASAPIVSCMTVTLTSDSGPNTLRAAVACAAAGPG